MFKLWRAEKSNGMGIKTSKAPAYFPLVFISNFQNQQKNDAKNELSFW